ncbi:PAS domain-containing sensor histidine kinase [Rhodobacteraceae bacterium N5(2021)]|uniref:histidine kinase n=1 Tax=Gymnodinialimonas phycosphaerae TaxID=2841589 RepID=A0A975TZ92_9RHOB|nr:PAS domain-containing sensor histidine kinase [Gymnodinialimonas phycosphaerae]MBY4892110.1 PAS domain-containing sensor histidine kinase [Gymnodinialimonas phycosphaerae]
MLDRFGRLRQSKRVRSGSAVALVLLAPVLALATFLAFSPLSQVADSTVRTLVLLADFVYILVIITLVLREVARIVASRRAQSAGSRLHLRLTAIFGVVALVPTVVVAVLAVLSVNMGLEGWFSDRVSTALGNSVDAAVAYQQEHRDDLEQDARALGAYLNLNRRAAPFLSDGDLRQVLTAGQSQIQRGLREAFVIDGAGELRARGARSYLFDYDAPSAADLARAAEGEVVLSEDRAQNEFRALFRLAAFPDRYLYVSREVDGQIIALLDETEQTVLLYRQVEADRGRLLFDFALLYLGFATLMILAAIWAGLSFGERLSRPVGQLAGAAQRVGQGDLDVRVPEETSDDEIAMLGRLFNQMTRQLKGQRDTLIEQNVATEESRRLFDSVLSSVTAGVIGLEESGRVDFMNRSAIRLLSLVEQRDSGLTMEAAVPEFAPLFEKLTSTAAEAVQEEIKLTRGGKQESLLVRMATRRNLEGALEGYVVAFDDVTQLVSAQRLAAWGDVARRIAHEIKNPLTPIQLSAERIKRKFSKKLEGEDQVSLEQMTEVIVRQTNDLRRIVDEFSKFARMPEPETRVEDVVQLLNNAVMLQRAGQPDMRFVTDIPDREVLAEVDATMIGQALTNLLKNGGEAIESLYEKGKPEGHVPQLKVDVALTEDTIRIDISDNGIGLPPDRAKLFEPYVTTRDKGTGLGLPIVKKIIEEHGGTLELLDAAPFSDGAHPGAMARITLPRLPDPIGDET